MPLVLSHPSRSTTDLIPSIEEEFEFWDFDMGTDHLLPSVQEDHPIAEKPFHTLFVKGKLG